MTQTVVNPGCPCPYNCPRHGKCTECREYHHKTGSRTYCEKHPKS